jgi:hypothetical protein
MYRQNRTPVSGKETINESTGTEFHPRASNRRHKHFTSQLESPPETLPPVHNENTNKLAESGIYQG